MVKRHGDVTMKKYNGQSASECLRSIYKMIIHEYNKKNVTTMTPGQRLVRGWGATFTGPLRYSPASFERRAIIGRAGRNYTNRI